MNARILIQPTDAAHKLAAGFLLAAAVFSLAFAWGYELTTGNLPCELCLAQRVPYYVGVVLAALAFFAAWRDGPAVVARGMLVLFGLMMLYGMSIAVYHAGVEWHFWEGPTACSGGGAGASTLDASNMLDRLSRGATTIIRCDQPYFRILGLSFAGMNVLASLFLAAVAFYGAALAARREPG